jgi:metabolite-proton symporter
MAELSPEARRKKIGDVLRVSSGNFLEQYDFFVFVFYARQIGQTYFPNTDPFASMANSLAVFAVGFFMRPLGAIILGAFIDRKGRRLGLIVTLAMMAVGTLSIAVTPSYAQIGIAAPIIVLAGRLLQGFSAGVELGGVSVYLAEIATPGNRGFYVSWQSGSQQVAVIFAALLGAGLTATLSAADMNSFGWRIPLLVGCAIIPLIFWLRRSLVETEAFEKMDHAKSATEIFRIVGQNWPLILVGFSMVVLTTTAFYLITGYTPNYGRDTLHLGATEVLVVTLCVGVSNFIWLPIGGALSDRIGRRPVLIAMPLLVIVTSYPLMLWLVAAPSFSKLLVTLLAFSLYYGVYNGAMVPMLAEIMPARVRTAGFSLAYALATALFGGLTPYVSNELIKALHNGAAPALWLSAAAVISLVGALSLKARAVSAQAAVI